MFSLVEQVKHSLCILLLRLGFITGYDLEVDAVLSHQAGKVSNAVTRRLGYTHAMVKPAKTPPVKTRTSDATARIHTGVPSSS